MIMDCKRCEPWSAVGARRVVRGRRWIFVECPSTNTKIFTAVSSHLRDGAQQARSHRGCEAAGDKDARGP